MKNVMEKCRKALIITGILTSFILLGWNGPEKANAETFDANISMTIDAVNDGPQPYYLLEMSTDGRLMAYGKGGKDDGLMLLLDTMASSSNLDDDHPVVLRAISYPDPEDPRHLLSTHPTELAAAICIAIGQGKHYKNFIVESFDWRVLTEIERILPAVQTCAMYCQQPAWGRNGEILRPYEKEPSPYLSGIHIDKFKGNAVWAAHSLKIDMLAPYYKDITIQQIEDAEALGMKVFPWKSDELDLSVPDIAPAEQSE